MILDVHPNHACQRETALVGQEFTGDDGAPALARQTRDNQAIALTASGAKQQGPVIPKDRLAETRRGTAGLKNLASNAHKGSRDEAHGILRKIVAID